jgi:hypothetical protein
LSNVERRKHIRKVHHFQSSLFKLELYSPAYGVTADVSPGGALIKSKDWRAFRPNDLVVVTLFIPPSFSGQDKTISVQGAAAVVRVDQKNEGVAVRFSKGLKQFQPIGKI